MLRSSLSKRTATGSALPAVLLMSLLASTHDASGQQPYYYQPAPDYYHNDTASGTVVGGAMGAITGAIIGGRSNRGEGALIGAGVGALTGNVLGRAKDRVDQRQAASGAAVVAQANQQAAAQAVTNYDLVISTLRSRGARLDLSPQGLIALKQAGVSDRVLLAAQDMSASRGYIPPALPVVRQVPPPTVIVTPAPGPYYRYYGPRYYPYHHTHFYYHGH